MLQSPGRLPADWLLWVPGQSPLHPGPLQQRDQHTLAHQVNHLSIFGFFKILYRVPTGKTIELTFTKFDVRHLSYLSFKFERIYTFFSSSKTENCCDHLTLDWGPCFTGSGERLKGNLAVPVMMSRVHQTKTLIFKIFIV